MARTRTSRFNLWRWSSDADSQQRSDFDDISAEIEARGAKASHGAIGARPTADASNRDSFFLVTDAAGGGVVGTLYYCDGTSWTSPNRFVGCRVRRSTTQTVATSSSTPVQFDTEMFDTDAFHDPAVNNSRITVPAGMDGYYNVGANVAFASSSLGYRALSLTLSGGGIAQVEVPAVNGNETVLQVETTVHIAAGDYLQAAAFHTHGGDLLLDTALSAMPSMWMHRIAPG